MPPKEKPTAKERPWDCTLPRQHPQRLSLPSWLWEGPGDTLRRVGEAKPHDVDFDQ